MNTKILIRALLLATLITPLPAIENTAWLARIEGMYMGQNNPTPFGRIGFAMDMIKQPDGSVHGRVHSDRDTYFDFKFRLKDKGGITFHETGSLGRGFVQSHELELIGAKGDTFTFATLEKPASLMAEVTADGNRLRVKVTVRGKPHVDLDMARVRDEKVVAKFRKDQERARELPGGSALQHFFAAAAAKTIDGNLPKPEQARLHVAESRKLVDQMATAEASELPSLAFLMKGHLDKAIELDPSFDEAHFALALWYLQSPELAAKSQEKVKEILATLERMNSPLAEVLRKRLVGGINRDPRHGQLGLPHSVISLKQVARLSGVSVRALHFYDEVGLLKPAFQPPNGYRFFEGPQLLTLQQILFYRELGFELKQIKSILGRPDFEKVAALMSHREVLEEALSRTRTLLETLDKTTEHLKGTKKMNDEEMFNGFSVAAGEDRFDEEISLGDEPIHCKLSGRDTGGALGVFEFTGTHGGPRHLHHEQDEWLYILTGSFDFEVGDRKFRAGTGESVFPRKVGHVWTDDSSRRLQSTGSEEPYDPGHELGRKQLTALVRSTGHGIISRGMRSAIRNGCKQSTKMTTNRERLYV